MATERTFGITISDADAAQCRTVGDLHGCVVRLLSERFERQGRNLVVDPEITWNLLVPLVVAQSGVRPEQVHPDAEWGRDLGID